jgi:predicted transcriptional regulator of viral defense system
MAKSNLRTLGALEAKVVLSLREHSREVVDVSDIRTLAGPGNATRNVVQQLIRKGWLSRVRRGRYILLPPEHGPDNLGENNVLALATAAVTPSYAGWWSAASFHGFTTQIPLTAFIAVTRKMSDRELEGSEVRFVQLSNSKFFGAQLYSVYGRQVPISSPVKTLIDCLDRPALVGGVTEVVRVADRALASVPGNEAVETAIRFGSKSVMQRLGAISDLVDRPLPDPARQRLRAAIPKSARSRFGRGRPLQGDIGYVAAWGLFIDARREELLAEVPRAKSRK